MKAPVYDGPGQRSWDSVEDPTVIDPTVSDPTDMAASVAEKQEVKWGSKRTFSFARRQPEAPSSPHRECRYAGCSRTGTTPFDLYCRTEGPEVAHFMPFGIMSRAQTAAGAGVVCLVIGALVLLSAAAPSRVPLYVLAGMAGALLLVLPLRPFSASQPLAVGGWAVVFTIVVVWRDGSFAKHAEQLIIFGAAAVLLVALISTVAFENDGARVADRDAQRPLAALLATGAALIALRLLVGVSAESGAVGAPVRQGLMTVAIGAFLLSLLLGLVFAIGHGVANAEVDIPFERPDRRPPPKFGRPPGPSPMSGGTLVQLAHAVWVLSVRVAALVVAGLEQVAAAGVWALDLFELTARRAWHMVHVFFAWLRRVAIETVKELVADIRGAVVLISSAARHWVLTAVVATGVLIATSIVAVVASVWFQSYLLGGAVWKGPVGLILGAMAASGLVVVWWALTRWPWRHVRDAAQHTSQNGGPSVLIGLIAIGWLDGIVGLLGVGPLRPGLMTITGTAVMAITTFVVLRRSRQAGAATRNARRSHTSRLGVR